MDNLTHSLVGLAAGRAGLEKKYGKGTIWTLVWASNLPDLDVLLTLPFGAVGFAIRRGITHSIFGLPVLCAGLAWLIRRRYPRQPFGRLFGLALLGAGLHVCFDLLNSYGVMLLHPFTRSRWELGCTFIIDLVLWAILLGMILAPKLGAGRERAAKLACLLTAAYLATSLGLRARSEALLGHVHDHDGHSVAQVTAIFPEPLGPHRFRGVHRHGARYEVFLIRPLAGSLTLVRTVDTDERHARVTAVRATPNGKLLDTFWKAPVWTVSGTAVFVRDLRFNSVVLGGLRSPFTFRFTVSPDGTVTGPERE